MPAPVVLPVAVEPVPPAPWIDMLSVLEFGVVELVEEPVLPVPDIDPLMPPVPELVPLMEPVDELLPEPVDLRDRLPRVDERLEPLVLDEVLGLDPVLIVESVEEPVPIVPLVDWPLPIGLPVVVVVLWPVPIVEPVLLPVDPVLPVEPVCATARAGTANAPSAIAVIMRIVILLSKCLVNGRRVQAFPKLSPSGRGGASSGRRAPARPSPPPPARRGCRRMDHAVPWWRAASPRPRG